MEADFYLTSKASFSHQTPSMRDATNTVVLLFPHHHQRFQQTRAPRTMQLSPSRCQRKHRYPQHLTHPQTCHECPQQILIPSLLRVLVHLSARYARKDTDQWRQHNQKGSDRSGNVMIRECIPCVEDVKPDCIGLAVLQAGPRCGEYRAPMKDGTVGSSWIAWVMRAVADAGKRRPRILIAAECEM